MLRKIFSVRQAAGRHFFSYLFLKEKKLKIRGLITEEYVRTVIRKRPRDVHKGNCGRVLIVSGRREMAGAAVLSGKGAIKTGSGLVHICTSKKIFSVLQVSVPELICTSWERTKNDLARYDAIAVGPGMGVSSRTKEILKKILSFYRKTVVIDADGLNTVAKYEGLRRLLKNTGAKVIITPHGGEAGRLLDMNAKDKSKLELGAMLTEKYGCITVVKGHATLVAVSEDDAYTNTTGNPGMATAGSGDVLTGVIVSLAGQGLSAEDAARAGVFVHGMAGDLASETYGEYGLTAGNIADHVPFALKKLTEQI